ncbi:hypothetical protein BDW42DRAFT_175574 [Aspergillus taichungensis]|uniref:C2H2-type domain-containing protein n=1 Tax=Aspergillus taichungensis TaxID=482145 RepID=A0A2J5HLL9_9EURO|nr:hypothetical protein BDW42DRAFT_175574 [Aspergillus taichungensis]
MSVKRKASDLYLNPKRVHKQEDIDPIYQETHSDAEYASSGESVKSNDSLHETPATPFSTTSTKYPSELKTHLCPFDGCTKAFNRPARLQEHLRSHNNERLFKCPHDDCDKTFLRASHLNHHVKSAHTGVRDYVCDRPGCGKSFVTGSRLRRHQAAHDGQDKYRCTEYPPCEETFRKHSTLQKHVMTVHLKQKPFQCTHIDPQTGQKCTMAFDSAGNLRAHESRVHTERRFSCAECSERSEAIGSSAVSFPTYALLQTHIRTMHPPQCPNCAIVCSTARELRRHLEVAHGDVTLEERKVFPCTVDGCDRSFTKKGNLTVHVRTVHQGEKRFACGETDLTGSKRVAGWTGADGCGKRYGSKLALEEHIRTAHMGFQNAKAERRQRLSGAKAQKNPPSSQRGPPGLSALAALTGEGYAEESGRHITCFSEDCPHRFFRNYDLWVHMGSKHQCSADEVRDLFMRRALLSGDDEPLTSDILGIYGLDLDVDDPASSCGAFQLDGAAMATTAADLGHDSADLNLQPSGLPEFPSDVMMQDDTSKIPFDDDMAMIDPLLAYNMMND